MQITKFEIIGLYNSFDISIPIKNNRVILTGVNGIGKSTVLNLFYYLVSQQWEKLLNFEFEILSISVNQKTYGFSKSDIEAYVRQRKRFTEFLPMSLSRRVFSLQEDNPILFSKILSQKEFDKKEKAHIAELLSIPPRHVEHVLRDITSYIPGQKVDEVFHRKIEEFAENITQKVMYLPTYRRIEKDLKLIIPDIEEKIRGEISSRKETEKYIELVEFGMEDIVKMVSHFSTHLMFLAQSEYNDFSQSFLQEIIRNEIIYTKVPSLKKRDIERLPDFGDAVGLTEGDIDNLTMTIEKQRSNKTELSDNEKYVVRYVVKLLEVFNKLEAAEIPIRDFINLCNSYLEGKRLNYDSKQRRFAINTTIDKELDLKNLSSGEKQIISLFCHLNLGKTSKNEYIVIIDEPELSLSVEWQKKLLPDVLSTKKCGFLMAVTHSPFVFMNELEEATIDLDDHKRVTTLV